MSAPLRLALIRQRYNPFGGAERFIERTVAALRAQTEQGGVEVTIYAREWQETANAKLIKINAGYLGRMGSTMRRDESFGDAVIRALNLPDANYDVIQSHERIPGIPVYRAGDGVHATWLVQRVKAEGWKARAAIALNPYHRYMILREHMMFIHPDLRAVICNSKMVRDDIAGQFGVPAEKLHLVYNGVDLECFTVPTPEQRHAAREALLLSQEAPVFLYVGSGFARKGVANLVTAFAKQRDDSLLVIVGKDKHAVRYANQAVELGVAGRIRFVGGVEGEAAMRSLYHAADVFVLPTLYDPMPNVIPEALASGLGVVTTTSCGGAELLNQTCGQAVDAFDAAALASAMQALLQTRLADPTGAQAAARAAAAPLSHHTQAAQLATLYRELARPATAVY